MAVVNGPDGSPITFPDEMSDNDINAALAKEYGGPAAAPASTTKGPPKPSFSLGLWQGFKIPLDNAAAALQIGANKLGLSSDTSATDQRTKDIQYLKDQAKAGTVPSVTGNLVGSIPAMAATTMATGNPLLAGAATGALSSEADNQGDLTKDIATGAAFGKAGQVGAKVLGSTINPVLKPAVRRLLSKGVSLTPGQIIGGSMHRLEDVSTAVPILGDVVKAAQNRGLKSANTSGVNDALSHINTSLPTNVPAGHPAIAHAQGAFEQAYDAVTPRMGLTMDQGLNTDLTDIGNRMTQNLPPEQSTLVRNMINNDVVTPIATGARGTVTNPATAQATGATLKDIDGVLRSKIKLYSGSDNPYFRMTASHLQEVQDAVHSAASRQNPQLASQLDNIDAGYAKLVPLETAAAKGKGGIFGGSDLTTASRQGDVSVRKRATAAGRGGPMQQYGEDMRDVMAPTIGESGTASRAVINAATGAALFGHGLNMSINPLGAGALAGLLAPYTKVGGAIVRGAVSSRPPGASIARSIVDKFGRPAATTALPNAANVGRVNQKNEVEATQ